MANPPFTVQIEDDTLSPYLDEAQRRLADLTELMAGIVGVMDASVQEAFETERDPETGAAWEPLTDAYVERPRRSGGRGGDAHPILQREGSLAKPQPDFGPDFAELAFPEVYAAIHQFGGTDDMPPGPAAVPARPYAALSDQARDEIVELTRAYLEP